MPIETVDANAWRHMAAARDVMELDRTRRMQALMPGETISFVDAPAAAPMRQAQSAGTLAIEAQAEAQVQTHMQSQSAATTPPPSAEQIAAALQSQMGALLALNLSPIFGVGPGGAAALLATTWAAMATAGSAASNAATVGGATVETSTVEPDTKSVDAAGDSDPTDRSNGNEGGVSLRTFGNGEAATMMGANDALPTADGNATVAGGDDGDANHANDQEDGNRSGEDTFYRSESRGWEAKWDSWMRSYDEQFSALNSFRGSVSQGYLDYANEMTLANLQPPSWDDFVEYVGFDDEFAPIDTDTAGAEPQDDVADLDFSGVFDRTFGITDSTTVETSAADTSMDSADAAGDANSTGRSSGEGSQRSEITEREQEGIEQSDEILFRRGDELAAANGLDPIKLADGSLQYPDGRIVTPRVEVITHPLQPDTSTSSGNTTANSNSGNQTPTSQSGATSVYGDPYVPVRGYIGVQPVGGEQNMTLARDLPPLPTDLTPNFINGPAGVGVPYRDQAGQVWYRTFDSTGAEKGWVTVAEESPTQSFLSAAAPVIHAGISAETRSGYIPLMIAGATTLVAVDVAIYLRDHGYFSAALDPEQVRDDQKPQINVPVSPGPAGTPGQVADNRDTSTPGYQSPDSEGTSATTLPITEPSWADQITTRNPDGNSPKPDFVPSRTVATGSLGGVPEGYVSPNPSDDRGIARENEAASAAAGYGYNVVQNPTLTPELRALNGISETADPDLLIEGKVFDVKSPLDAASAEAAIERSVEKLQSHRFLINANDFADPEAGVRDLAARLRERPPEGLQEVKVLVNGVIRNIFP